MSDRTMLFDQYAGVVDALRQHFPDQRNELVRNETSTQYEFSAPLNGVDWLQTSLPALVAVLLPARFNLRLVVTVWTGAYTLLLYRRAAELLATCEKIDAAPGGDPGTGLPPDAVRPVEILSEMIVEGATDIPFLDIISSLAAISVAGLEPGLRLRVFLDKISVNKRFLAGVVEGDRPLTACYLFPDAFIAALEGSSLVDLEHTLCQIDHRTVVPIFAFSGFLGGDLLAVVGRGYQERLDDLLSHPLQPEVAQKNRQTVAFRHSQGQWISPTQWLTPDTFAFSAIQNRLDVRATDLNRAWRALQALLSAAFLADQVDMEGGLLRVEYRGLGRINLPIPRTELVAQDDYLERLYGLYTYAYQGLSADKLEVVQQFLSLMVNDIPSLCRRAEDVRDAAKKTYDRTLIARVKEYFEARQKIQDRIKSAVDATATTVIGLSRDLSSDLYKIAGFILAAVVGALLKPDLSLWVGLAAAVGIAIYLLLVVFFHLSTMKRAYDLGTKQNEIYIESFQEVLSSQEIAGFKKDERLKDANSLFTEKRRWATGIYLLFLVAALIVAGIAGYRLAFPTLTQSTGTPTPVATAVSVTVTVVPTVQP